MTINHKTYTVRLVNKTYEDCDTKENGFSQTACGFVFEFVEYIGTNVMNSTSTNIGSFPATSAYNYLKSGIYESLPSDLKNVIADTYIVYGHGASQEENNFSATEKLYLPSVKELYGNNCYGLTNICNGDTANDYTKELEYYKYNDNKEDRKKHDVDSNTAQNLWLRSPSKDDTNGFLYVSMNGSPGTAFPQQRYGLAPLFRIE